MVRFIAPATTRRAFSQEQVARFFFAPVFDDSDHNGDHTGSWSCRICSRAYRQERGQGYSNLVAHLNARRVGYMDRLLEASVSATGSIGAWVSQRATVRYGHVDLTVGAGLPLKYLNLPPIAYETLHDIILRVVTAVEATIGEELPPKFGVVFDGWTHGSEQFLAIFVAYDEDGAIKTPLLSLSPIVKEPDDSHDADSHLTTLTTVLKVFGATPPPTHTHTPFRVLGGRHLQREQEVHQTARRSADFFELREFLDGDDDAIAELLPFPAWTKKLKTLLDQMKMIESVSKRLQSDVVSMRDARVLFDALRIFTNMNFTLGPNASIVADPAFESAIVKLQSGRQLSRSERAAVTPLRVAGGNDRRADDEDAGIAERVLKRARVSEQPDQYVLVPAVLPTPSTAERLFGMDRAMIGLDCHSLQPVMVEALLFPKCNCTLWDLHTVHEILEEDI
ncbi:hypothetical protein BBJ28_00019766 [Nothophytophthora sp. Chile5]|nr:hypothetical protein BBJ28_00019766 [Nothophytophthora sp. Chile5]